MTDKPKDSKKPRAVMIMIQGCQRKRGDTMTIITTDEAYERGYKDGYEDGFRDAGGKK